MANNPERLRQISFNARVTNYVAIASAAALVLLLILSLFLGTPRQPVRGTFAGWGLGLGAAVFGLLILIGWRLGVWWAYLMYFILCAVGGAALGVSAAAIYLWAT
jgi:hypothetical protein